MLSKHLVWAAAFSAAVVGCSEDDSSLESGLEHEAEHEGVADQGGAPAAGRGGSASPGRAGSSSDAAGSGDEEAAAGTSAPPARLQSGTYSADNVIKLTDDCGLLLEDGSFTSIEIVNTGEELSLGRKYDDTTDPAFDPPGYGLGSGPYTTATTATLKIETRASIADPDCQWDVMRTTKVTYTGDNAVSVDYVDNERNPSAGCKGYFEWTDACQSHYTFDLKKEE